MATTVLAIGLVVAAALLALLLATLVSTNFRIWPTPGDGTWQSYVFWPLFRGLNAICFLMAALDTGGYLGLPIWLRVIALLARRRASLPTASIAGAAIRRTPC
jgi:hypothetical protein